MATLDNNTKAANSPAHESIVPKTPEEREDTEKHRLNNVAMDAAKRGKDRQKNDTSEFFSK